MVAAVPEYGYAVGILSVNQLYSRPARYPPWTPHVDEALGLPVCADDQRDSTSRLIAKPNSAPHGGSMFGGTSDSYRRVRNIASAANKPLATPASANASSGATFVSPQKLAVCEHDVMVDMAPYKSTTPAPSEVPASPANRSFWRARTRPIQVPTIRAEIPRTATTGAYDVRRARTAPAAIPTT
jgi:hypothetical protein